MAEAARRAGRDPEDVEMLAATKYVDAADLPALHAAGIRLVGENRTDALLAKQAAHGDLSPGTSSAHLQSRKVRDVVGRVRLVHALESETPRAAADRAAAAAPVTCLLEVNVAGRGRPRTACRATTSTRSSRPSSRSTASPSRA